MTKVRVEICEVGPRDGLQNEKIHWSVDQRIALIDRLAAAGLRRIEAVSFVNPKRVPQMAEAEEVMAGISRKDGVCYSGLALNGRGVERAIAAGMDEIRCVLVASETFSQRNNGRPIADTLAQFTELAGEVNAAGRKLTFAIAAAFGCPFEGQVPARNVIDLAGKLAELGPHELYVADTIGAGVPNQVRDLIAGLRARVGPDLPIGCHFHNTRNTGYANAVAAIDAGAAILDASICGIGGCPFAPRATGNIATEDLVHMLRNMGVETGLDLDRLVGVAKWVETQMGVPTPGMVMKAGAFPEAAVTDAG